MNNEYSYVLYDPIDNDYLSAIYASNINTCGDWYNAIRFGNFSDANFFAAVCQAKYETSFEVVRISLTFEIVKDDCHDK